MITALPLRWFLLIFFSAVIHQASSVYFSVKVKSPVSGLLGSSVSLHCAVTNNMDVRPLEVRWYRPKLFNTPALFYKDTQIQKSPVDVQYQGRVFLLGDLEKGDVSVKLENLTLADRGDYVCHVISATWYDKATLSLRLRVVGSTPVLSIREAGGGQVNVSCQSHGWLPEPSITWTDKDGRDLKHHSNDKFTNNSVGTVDVSSWLIVSPSESEWISCSVGLSDQERKEDRIMVHVPARDTESLSGYIIIIPVLLVLCVIGVAVYCVLRKKGLILSRSKGTESTGAGTQSETEPLNKIRVENQDQTEAPSTETEQNSEQSAKIPPTAPPTETGPDVFTTNTPPTASTTNTTPTASTTNTTTTASTTNTTPTASTTNTTTTASTTNTPPTASTTNTTPTASTTNTTPAVFTTNTTPTASTTNTTTTASTTNTTPAASTTNTTTTASTTNTPPTASTTNTTTTASTTNTPPAVFIRNPRRTEPMSEDSYNTEQNSKQSAEMPPTAPPSEVSQQESSEQQNPESLKDQTHCAETGPADSTSDIRPTLTTSEISYNLDQVKKYKVNISIDPEETPECLIYEGNEVKRNPAYRHSGSGYNTSRVGSNPECKIFSLCKERFQSGKHYWEVKVRKSQKTVKLTWFVGVATDEAEKKYNVRFKPQDGFWVLCYEGEKRVSDKKEKGLYINDEGKLISLPDVNKELTAVGVFLDCDTHTLSFYNINTHTHIYTFTNVDVRTSLRPLISPGVKDSHPVWII